MEAANAQRQSFYRIQDPVFICEQQFMATLIQIPRAINPELFRALTVHCFQTPVFQTLFQAVAHPSRCCRRRSVIAGPCVPFRSR